MSTRPAKSLSSTAAACVVSLDPDDVEVSELPSLHPAATSARATMVMRIKRIESVTILKGVARRLLNAQTPRVGNGLSLFTLLPRRGLLGN
jgi:hypothetical protein